MQMAPRILSGAISFTKLVVSTTEQRHNNSKHSNKYPLQKSPNRHKQFSIYLELFNSEDLLGVRERYEKQREEEVKVAEQDGSPSSEVVYLLGERCEYHEQSEDRPQYGAAWNHKAQHQRISSSRDFNEARYTS